MLASENINKGKSILGAPPKLVKKENKNPRAKKGDDSLEISRLKVLGADDLRA